jgi:predicted nuclease of predicted toxin-antitoxin system
MKLLFDQNLSPRLVNRLADLFPDSLHVHSVGLDCASDEEIWDYARFHSFAVVTRDDDFNHLSVVRGCPPKIIWLQIGNCSTAKVESILRERAVDVLLFEQDESAGTLVLR